MPQSIRYSVRIFVSTAVVFALVGGVFWSGHRLSNNETMSRFLEHEQKAKEKFENDKLKEKILRAIAANDPNWAAIKALNFLLDNPYAEQKGIDGIIGYAETVKGLSVEVRDSFINTPQWGSIRRLADDSILPTLVELRNEKLLAPAVAGVVKFTVSEPKWQRPPVLKPFWDRTYRGLRLVGWLVASAVSFFIWLIFMAGNGVTTRRTEWRSFWVRLSIIITAPISFPALAIYGLVLAIENGRRSFDLVARSLLALRSWLTVFCYRSHLLCRLPAPVLQPLALDVPPTTASADERVQEHREESPSARSRSTESQWYVFERHVLLGQKHLLAQSGVEVYPISINAPRRINGVAVSHDDLVRFETALGLNAARVSNTETDIEQTVLRSYGALETDIVIQGIEPELASFARKVLQAVCVGQNMSTVVLQSHCDNSIPASVRIVSKNTSERDRAMFDSLYGYEAPTGRIFGVSAPDDEPRQDICDPAGNIAASVIEGDVHILWSWFRYLDMDWTGEVLARILREAFMILKVRSPKEIEDLEFKKWREGINPNREQYVKMRLVRLETELEALSGQLEECDKLVEKADRTINEQVRRRHDIAQRLARAQTGELDKEKEELGREFDQLAGADCVTALRAQDNRVEVDTRTIYIKHEGATYQIGRFTIIIYNDGTVRFRTRDNTNPGDHLHPHIRANGKACFGNITEAVSTMAVERQYAAVVNLLFRYLESYNPSSPYATINHWKMVSKEET